MTSENGIRTIRGAFSESQIPEIVKAGIDIIVEQSGRYYNNFHQSLSNDGKNVITEYTSITQGIKTITTHSQPVRPMTDEEQKAWDDGTFYEMMDDFFNNKELYWFSPHFIDGVPYAATGESVFIGDRTEPVTRADFDDRSNPLDIPMRSLAINNVRGEAQVDSDGNMLFLDIAGTATAVDIFGERLVIEVRFTLRISDIGTSNPDCPIPGAAAFFTPDNMRVLVGNSNVGVYFKLNEDGSINTDSVSTMHPDEQSWGRMPMPPAAIGRGYAMNVVTGHIDIDKDVDAIPQPATPAPDDGGTDGGGLDEDED
jgi:hypothetical protein